MKMIRPSNTSSVSGPFRPAVLTGLAVALVASACARPSAMDPGGQERSVNDRKATTMTQQRPEIEKLDPIWKKTLTSEQYMVTRQAATERAFGAAYEQFQKQGEGTYYCICCGAELFTSKEKFHSGCGWPSFYDPSKAKNVVERRDTSLGAVRTEVICKRCEAHLGHVFEGEGFKTPTDRRFCINAASLNFVAAGGKPPVLLDVGSVEVREKKADVAKDDAPEK